MKLWYIHLIILLIITWLSLGTAHTDTEGPWVWDKPVSAEIKAAMQEMGPNYHYRTLHDGTFQVSTKGIDLEKYWKRLRI